MLIVSFFQISLLIGVVVFFKGVSVKKVLGSPGRAALKELEEPLGAGAGSAWDHGPSTSLLCCCYDH